MLRQSALRPQAQTVPAVDWTEFLARLRWRQGEHVSLIGPTGSGKTTLAYHLLPKRSYVVVFATKPRDTTLARFADDNDYSVIRNWPPGHSQDKVVLWPRLKETADIARQQAVFAKAAREIFAEGRWAIYVDEVFYATDVLKMEQLLKLFWTQGRSLGISLIGATQRPRAVPLYMYDQATHLFFWRFNDENDVKRIGGIGAVNAALIRDTVLQLPRHHFLYVNAVSGQMAISIVR